MSQTSSIPLIQGTMYLSKGVVLNPGCTGKHPSALVTPHRDSDYIGWNEACTLVFFTALLGDSMAARFENTSLKGALPLSPWTSPHGERVPSDLLALPSSLRQEHFPSSDLSLSYRSISVVPFLPKQRSTHLLPLMDSWIHAKDSMPL